jgi:hypothetical protein
MGVHSLTTAARSCDGLEHLVILTLWHATEFDPHHTPEDKQMNFRCCRTVPVRILSGIFLWQKPDFPFTIQG